MTLNVMPQAAQGRKNYPTPKHVTIRRHGARWIVGRCGRRRYAVRVIEISPAPDEGVAMNDARDEVTA